MNKTKQIVVDMDSSLLYPDCEKYLLIEPYLKTEEIREKSCGRIDILDFAFNTEEQYQAAAKYIYSLTNKFVKEYTQTLNKYQHVEFSENQWKYIYGRWLYYMLFMIYNIYLSYQMLEDKDSCFIVKSVEEPKYIRGMDASNAYIRSAKMKAYMWSEVADYIGILVKKKTVLPQTSSGKSKLRNAIHLIAEDPKKVYAYRDVVGRKLAKHIKGGIQNISDTVEVLLIAAMGLYSEDLTMSQQSNGKIGVLRVTDWRKRNDYLLNGMKYNEEARKATLSNVVNCENDFEKMAEDFFIRFLPIANFEGFSVIYKEAEKLTKQWNLKKIYCCDPSIELLHCCFAIQEGKGVEINGMQHSAVYGAVQALAYAEWIPFRNWCSWGWNYSLPDWISVNLKPVAISRMPKLPSIDLNSIEATDKLLLVCNAAFFGECGQGWSYRNYVINQMEFIGGLNQSLRKRLVVRTFQGDYLGEMLKHRCSKEYPEVQFETKEDKLYSVSLFESELVICDYYGSGHIEALALNKPFVMFEGCEILTKSPVIVGYFHKLEEYNIYRKHGRELAEVLNKNTDYISVFKDKNVQILIEDYKNTFMGSSKDRMKAWFSEFIG